MADSTLRALVDLRDRQIQKGRIQFGQRLDAIKCGADDDAGSRQREVLERWFVRFSELEAELDKDIADAVLDFPIFEHLKAVKGISFIFGAKLIALIDIERDDRVSSLWKYAGYGKGDYWQDESGKIVAPKSGWQWKKNDAGEKERIYVVAKPAPGWKLVNVRDRPIEKWVLPYNKRLKSTLHVIAGSFLMCDSPYRQVYDSARDYYAVNRPEWNKGRQHNAALRKMIKHFLKHLWERWRQLEGLPTPCLYVENHLGHKNITKPEDFGWPAMTNEG